MSIEIKHRITGKTIYTSATATDLRMAVEEAVSYGDCLDGARLTAAGLYGARLNGARLDGASLNGACLYGASLNGACLCGASLDGAQGIFSFGPIGTEKRIGYAVAHGGGAMVKLGCFWGSEAAALAAISVKYGPESDYAAQVALACKIVMCGHIAATKTEAA